LKITPDALAAHLAERLLPAYLVSGDEPLLAGEAADAIRVRARAAGFAEREVHFIERAADWEEVRASPVTRCLARAALSSRMSTANWCRGRSGARALLKPKILTHCI
jgi:DNA polymerase-3 subunit delta